MKILKFAQALLLAGVLINPAYSGDTNNKQDCNPPIKPDSSDQSSDLNVFIDPNTKEIINKEEYLARGYKLPTTSNVTQTLPKTAPVQEILSDGTVLIHHGDNFQSNLVARNKNGKIDIRHAPVKYNQKKRARSNTCAESE